MNKEKGCKISIVYDGPAIEDNTIEIKELAPSLISLGELLDESFSSLNGNNKKLSVRVNALNPGSFEVSLIIAEATTDVLDFFNSSDVTGVLAALTTLGLINSGAKKATGLIPLLKKSKGQKPQKAVEEKDGNVKLVFNSPTVNNITISGDTFKLYKSLSVRSKAEDTFSILNQDGIDKVSFKNKTGEIIETVQKEEATFFKKPELSDIEEKIVSEDERIAIVSLVNVALRDSDKWRLSTGGEKPFYATMIDKKFQSDININSISFRKDDRLKVKMKTTQTSGPKGLNETIEIIEVIEHFKAAEQLDLKIDVE